MHYFNLHKICAIIPPPPPPPPVFTSVAWFSSISALIHPSFITVNQPDSTTLPTLADLTSGYEGVIIEKIVINAINNNPLKVI